MSIHESLIEIRNTPKDAPADERRAVLNRAARAIEEYEEDCERLGGEHFASATYLALNREMFKVLARLLKEES